jgi:hypothetical protein
MGISKSKTPASAGISLFKMPAHCRPPIMAYKVPSIYTATKSEDNAIVIIKANSLIKSDIGSVATIPLVSSSASTLDRVKIMVPAKVMVACD